MRTDEFFMAFAEIDEDLIANAKPMAQKPIILKPERRSPRRTFAAAAACLAVAVIGIAAIIGVIRYRDKLVSPNRTTSARYPDDAKYQYKGDFSELELCCYALVDRLVYWDFDSLVQSSDLIVVGTFVDNARQDQPLEGDELGFDRDGGSYNKLRIDAVYKGNVGVGDEIIVGDSYYVNDGRLMYIGSCSLTPMIKGEQWVYFLAKEYPEYGDYYCPLLTEGRYPVPENENTFVLKGYEYDVDNYPKDIYTDVKIMLGHADGVQKLNLGDLRAAYEFTMPEFIGDKFAKRNGGMYVSRGSGSPELMFGAPWIESVYLADLNGDGKREIISECQNSETQHLGNYITVYDHANSKLYTLRQPEDSVCHFGLEIRDNVLYVAVTSVASTVQPYDMPLTLDIMTEEYLNPGRVVYNGKTYVIVNSGNFNGVKMSVGLTQYEYEAGDEAEVLVVVENTTDKAIGIPTPVTGSGYYPAVSMHIGFSRDGIFLPGWSVLNTTWCAEALSTYFIQPGETHYQPMRFSTLEERFDPDGTIKALYKPLGEYEGTVVLPLLEDPNKRSSNITKHSLDFNIRLVQRENLDAEGNFFKKFTMDEFPNAVFTCTEYSVSVTENGKSTVLFDGVQIDTLYLYDLNGDGKRELCSSANFGSGIVDYRIMVYDFANKKLYRLSDRGYYDYRLVSVHGYNDQCNLYFEKFKYASTDEILNDVLTLDKMTEIENGQPDTRELIKGVTEIIKSPEDIGSGQFFGMKEFPDKTFYVTEKTIKAVNDWGFEEELLANDAIQSVYLYDLNADGRRELVVVRECVPLSNGSPQPPRKVITVYDYENATGFNVFSKYLREDSYSLHIENGELYVVIDGVVSSEPATMEQMMTLAKS